MAVQIVGTNAEENARMFGRHFDLEDELVSRITRRSIDLLKENYRVSIDPNLIVENKGLWHVQH